MKNRLSKVLAASGVASRRAAEKLIFDGRVSVNGETLLKPEERVDSEIDEIMVDGEKIRLEDQKVYYILNKPKGYICSSKQVNRSKIVLDLFESSGYRLFTVGRLDKDTEGLLLVTNDGHFANRVIHPSNSIDKEYLVKVNQDLKPHHLKIISQGAWVERTYVKPVKVVKVRKGTLKITVKEGKKHEVRSLVEKADLKIILLRRIRIGGVTLGKLPIGDFRSLTDGELQGFNGHGSLNHTD